MDIHEYIHLYQQTLDGSDDAVEQVHGGLRYLIHQTALGVIFPGSKGDEHTAHSLVRIFKQSKIQEGAGGSAQLCRLVAGGVLGLIAQNSHNPAMMSFLRNKILHEPNDEVVLENLAIYRIHPGSHQIPPALLIDRERVSDLEGWLAGEKGKMPWLHHAQN